MPHIASQFHLALKAGDYDGKSDGFRITGTRSNIHVEAATTPTLLFGVNWYLKYVAHLNVSTNGSRLGHAGLTLPTPDAPITKPALYPFRYALNENTDGYTTPYWDLARWQHEIDILALSGTNAVLIQRGTDYVLYRAFRDAGYDDAAIRNWITHPAHQNWQLMGNMCCFIEPISLQLMQKRAASAHQIVAMLRSLGITPVLPGFYGVVPNDFAKYVPGANVIIQSKDWGGFTRPAWLDPRDPAFTRLAASFYKHQAEMVGDSTIFDMETFQEGGDAGNVPVREGAQAIQSALEKAHPGALWFMMAWQGNPQKELLEGVDRSRILIADIEQGRYPRENRDQEFMGARWLWGGLWEFGGRTTLGAPLYDHGVRFPQNAAKPGSKIAGTALFTEGLDSNPFAFDLYTEMAWRNEPVDLEAWASQYAERRYGGSDPHAKKAWHILLHTSYSLRADGVSTHGERDASHESLFTAQPSLTATRSAHWAPDVVRYNMNELRPALTELLSVAPELRHTASYRFDLTDTARQVMADESRRLLPEIKTAYEARDTAKFHALTAEWMRDMQLQDNLLATNEFFLLGRWLSYLPPWQVTPAERTLTNYDARSILTTWGDRKASEQDLHEYSNRDWAGLTSDYYMPRWQMFFASLDVAMQTNSSPRPIDWYAVGDTFNRSTKTYSPTPVGDTYAAALKIAEALHLEP
ncbi:MAG: alpha-N-acetylglucosaminidase TIM-barrel domain-containing protein [Acidobacteriota bacterium]